MEQNYRHLGTIRSAAILTTSYVAATVIGPQTSESGSPYNQLILLIDYTKGSSDNLDLKIEFSHDGTNYYQETFQSISAGVSTNTLGEHLFAASGSYALEIPIKYEYIKVSVKARTNATGTSCTLKATLGVN